MCDSSCILFLVQILLANGAHVNTATTDDGVTPLYAAAYDGHSRCVQVVS